LEGLGLPDEANAPLGFPQAGVVDLAGRFQPGKKDALLGGRDPQGQLTDEAGSPFPGSGLAWWWLLD
jgi:hypothetical protein